MISQKQFLADFLKLSVEKQDEIIDWMDDLIIFDEKLPALTMDELRDELLRLRDQLSVEFPGHTGDRVKSSHTYLRMNSVRYEINQRKKLVRQEVDKTTQVKELTRAAHKFALKEGQPYKRKGQKIPYDAIAEKTMGNFFTGVIARETGKQHANGHMELTEEWKKKRDSVRNTLRGKLK